MSNLINIFFPTPAPNAAGAKDSSAQGKASQNQQFSPEFFELLQGEISALTAPGKGTITTADINKLSDTQIEILGNFLSNVEVGENGEMTYSSPYVDSVAASSDVIAESSVAAQTNIRAELDPAVVDVIEQIPALPAKSDGNTEQDVKGYETLSIHMEQLLAGLPKENRSGTISFNASGSSSTETGKLTIETSAEAQTETNADIIATGMTPESMLTFLKNLAASAELKSGHNTAAQTSASEAEIKAKAEAEIETDITFALTSPTQPQPIAEEQNVIFLPRGVVVTANKPPQGEGSQTKDNTPTSAATHPAGENVARALNKALQSLTTQGSVSNLYGQSTSATAENSVAQNSFDRVLGMFEQPATTIDAAKGTQMPEGLDKSLNLPTTATTHAEARSAAELKMSAGLSTIPSNMEPNAQNMSASKAWDSIFPEGINWSTSPSAPATANNSVTLSTMTSLLSQGNAATAAHPSTQMVAATITKAGQGENKNITLRLDPPDLGRVQVRMELSEDNIVKAIISSEKPQTHMMLQRDAHALERALQEAGLDSADGALEFELSEDGSLFGDNDGRGGENDSGGGSSSHSSDEDSAETETLETKMSWHVDPETGYMHYNLVV